MCEEEVELVITDLGTPERQGLDLLAYGQLPLQGAGADDESLEAVAAHSGTAVLERTPERAPAAPGAHLPRARGPAERQRGDYRPVGLHDLLRVLSYEQDSCTLQVKSG